MKGHPRKYLSPRLTAATMAGDGRGTGLSGDQGGYHHQAGNGEKILACEVWTTQSHKSLGVQEEVTGDMCGKSPAGPADERRVTVA